MRWIKQHLILFLILIAAIVAFVWYGLSSSAPEPILETSEVAGGTLADESADQEIVASLLALRSVSLSGTIFTDPAFVSLRDFGTTLVAEPWGRDNPFAPLNNRSTATTTRGQGR